VLELALVLLLAIGVGYQPGMDTTDPGFIHNAVLGGLSSLASGIANAATRSVISGSDFGDNIIAALSDTIGQTIREYGRRPDCQ
jgi:hypothetical protein